MYEAYFRTRFRIRCAVTDELWLPEFGMISAYATTGERWSDERNQAADQKLEAELRSRSVWLRRIVGYSPTSGHAEPSWAVGVPYEEACELGLQFRQDAVYHVRGGTLYVSYCDDRRRLIPVGGFRERLDAAEESGAD